MIVPSLSWQIVCFKYENSNKMPLSAVFEFETALKDRAERLEAERQKAVLLAACSPDPSVAPLAGRKKTYLLRRILVHEPKDLFYSGLVAPFLCTLG
jgi:hypothetical protein